MQTRQKPVPIGMSSNTAVSSAQYFCQRSILLSRNIVVSLCAFFRCWELDAMPSWRRLPICIPATLESCLCLPGPVYLWLRHLWTSNVPFTNTAANDAALAELKSTMYGTIIRATHSFFL